MVHAAEGESLDVRDTSLVTAAEAPSGSNACDDCLCLLVCLLIADEPGLLHRPVKGQALIN